ncbi:hypothetical protein CYMTET_12070 [Cymbomonas tetramitiformis]|uniref:EGF-like domain-containing protein n=1 Tax=Cymbomonas tetramitiformis TaxID=36881 RepID=A0AAE0GL44_9CHLO|nr:hypothetical protein CYMTET_12070 [Cymbomonas tetramitiformis]
MPQTPLRWWKLSTFCFQENTTSLLTTAVLVLLTLCHLTSGAILDPAACQESLDAAMPDCLAAQATGDEALLGLCCNAAEAFVAEGCFCTLETAQGVLSQLQPPCGSAGVALGLPASCSVNCTQLQGAYRAACAAAAAAVGTDDPAALPACCNAAAAFLAAESCVCLDAEGQSGLATLAPACASLGLDLMLPSCLVSKAPTALSETPTQYEGRFAEGLYAAQIRFTWNGGCEVDVRAGDAVIEVTTWDVELEQDGSYRLDIKFTGVSEGRVYGTFSEDLSDVYTVISSPFNANSMVPVNLTHVAGPLLQVPCSLHGFCAETSSAGVGAVAYHCICDTGFSGVDCASDVYSNASMYYIQVPSSPSGAGGETGDPRTPDGTPEAPFESITGALQGSDELHARMLVLGPGRYTGLENVGLDLSPASGLVFTSIGGEEVTVIDCMFSTALPGGALFKFSATQYEIRLEGLTIQHCRPNLAVDSSFGAPIIIQRVALMVLRHVVLRHNQGLQGGALRVSSSNIKIYDSKFINNSVVAGAQGGALVTNGWVTCPFAAATSS